MANLKPFRGYRPTKGKEIEIASRPYDVLNKAEARKEAEGKEHSFLHVVKPEIDLDDSIDPYSPKVYQKGKENFAKMVQEGVLVQDSQDCLYIYQLEMDGHLQTGYWMLEAISDYFDGTVKLHELTRPDKEEDRKNHVRVGQMHAEPVFFAYPSQAELDAILVEISTLRAPDYNFIAEDGIRHTLWAISDPKICHRVSTLFSEKVPYVYVADGHHRTAAGALVGQEMVAAQPNADAEAGFRYFMAVLFPDSQLKIIDYNRVVKDLNGHEPADFLKALAQNFEVALKGPKAYKPSRLHELSLYLEGNWYALQAKAHTYDDADPIKSLDVTVLSEQVLAPLLNITDLRRDKRIEFVGGIRGLEELSRRVDNGEMKLAFALYPVSMKQLIHIADSGNIMPPKTTWFEPKLRSGLVVHVFEEG